MQRFKYITRILSCSLFLLHISVLALAQAEKNPFDLTHRVKETGQQTNQTNRDPNQNPFDISKRKMADSTIQNNPIQSVRSENPFDKSPVAETSSGSVKKLSETPSVPKKDTGSEAESAEFLFWIMLFVMIYLALEITLFKSLMNDVYRAFTNDNVLKLLHREQRDFIAFPFLLMYIFFFFNFGIFVFLTFHYFGLAPKSLEMLSYCILGVGVLFLLKHILLKIVEMIFPVQKEIKLYSFSLVIFSSILGFALVPFNVVAAFAAENLAEIALYGGLVTVFAISVFCSLRGLFLASKYLSFHKFHFFMYLCTVEIAPVLVVIKLLLITAGIH